MATSNLQSSKIRLALLLVLLLFAAFAVLRTFYLKQVDYGEAELIVDGPIREIRDRCIESRNDSASLPSTLSELLDRLAPEHRHQLEGHVSNWSPEGDPIFEVKANSRFLLKLRRDLVVEWVVSHQ